MSFRPPIPYNGQAPPCVPGIHPNAWQHGMWKPNPYWNPHAFQQQQQRAAPVQWIPASHWAQIRAQQAQQHAAYYQQQQQQQQQNYNPYRKQVKPPSAEYLSHKLVENPLGLENMDPSKSLYNDIPEIVAGQDEGAAHQTTPWIWTARPLEPTDDNTQPEHIPAAAPASDDDEDEDASDDASSSSGESISSSEDESTDDDESSPHAPPRRTIQQPQPEYFTAPGPLRPTFSPNIVRTPDHCARSGSLSIDARMQSLALGDSTSPSRQQSLSRHLSMPDTSRPTAISGVSHLSDEPDPMLSPLIMPHHRTLKAMANSRLSASTSSSSTTTTTLSRHSSVPVVLNSIPETAHRTSTSSASTYARRQSHDVSHSHHLPQYQYKHVSPSTTPPPTQPYIPMSPPPPARTSTAPASTLSAMLSNPRKPQYYVAHHSHTYPQPTNYSYQTPPHSAKHPRDDNGNSGTPTPSSRRNSSDREYEHRSRSKKSSSSSSSSTSTPTTTSPPHQPTFHPYPTPPSHSSSPQKISTTSSSSPPHPNTNPTHPTHHLLPPMPTPHSRRAGIWNARGDHLTPTGFLVPAPPSNAYPPELASYPRPITYNTPNDTHERTLSYSHPLQHHPSGDSVVEGSKNMGLSRRLPGFMDEHGTWYTDISRPLCPDIIPELPALLGGQPKQPKRTYASFVRWI